MIFQQNSCFCPKIFKRKAATCAIAAFSLLSADKILELRLFLRHEYGIEIGFGRIASRRREINQCHV